MAELPTGTVTFLFTDIEGSTVRWEQQTQAMQTALVQHDALVRSAIEEHGGVVFKTVGDAFYAVFASAPDGLQAALAAQRALYDASWSEAIGALRVRMALHTGTPEARGDDYFGPPLNRVARLLSAGHGGQTLISAATQELVRDHLQAGASLRDLGEHRLKDLTRPERIFQVIAHGLPEDFARLRTLNERPHNLPVQRDPLIGRDKEVVEVVALLRRPDVGLVTLTGPGGIGKTRLSLQVAAELLDDFGAVWFVELAPVSDVDQVASTIAHTLELQEVRGQTIRETLLAYVRDKQLLLVLDNFEQLVAAAPLIADLLAAAPRLKVLVSSREVLHLYGEHEYAVAPLALPELKRLPAPERLSQFTAVALFIQRAQAVKPDFQVTNDNAPAVAEICVRLDGLPLAIELAAARVKLFSPQALMARLDNRLKLLTGGARDRTARQQTLRGAIDWSYDLLDAGERTLFARLAVFVGGRTLEAAEVVCDAEGDLPIAVLDGVESLVDKSLLQRDEADGEEPRFTMLETIREYALERLHASGEVEELQQRHAAYFVALAEMAVPELAGRDQELWLERLESEHGNLRAALKWAVDRKNEETALRLAGALWRFWLIRGHLLEGQRWLATALELGSGTAGRGTDTVSPAVRAAALNGAGAMADQQGDYAAARIQLEEALALWRVVDDKRGMGTSLNNLGLVARSQGDYRAARTLHEESLALWRAVGDRRGIAAVLDNLGLVAHAQGDYVTARALNEESLAHERELGNKGGIAGSLDSLGRVAHAQGDYAAARALHEECLALRQELGDKVGIALSLDNLGVVALAQGDYAKARALLVESLGLRHELGETWGIGQALEGLASLAAAEGHAEQALRLAGAAATIREAIAAPLSAADQKELDRSLATARHALGSEASAAAWAEGRAMTQEQAVANALADIAV